MRGESYGRYYVATLNSKEKIIVFLDEKALSLNKRKITLPIGEILTNRPKDWFEKIQEDYAVEDISWYVDMTSSEWRTTGIVSELAKVKDCTMFVMFLVTYIIATIVFAKMGWLPQRRYGR